MYKIWKADFNGESIYSTADQARELLDCARDRGFYYRGYLDQIYASRKKIDHTIASGQLGEICSLTANLGYALTDKKRMTDPALAGGALLDVGIYPLNFASMVLGNDVEK